MSTGKSAILLLLLGIAWVGCNPTRTTTTSSVEQPPATLTPRPASSPPPAQISAAHRTSPLSAPSAAAPADSSPLPPLTAREASSLFQSLSEPGEYFFSDNLISNETTYLDVADELRHRVPPGSAYLGVGPEQNYAYIALTRPALAFLVDIRRDNALLHLLYQALLRQARSRAQFVTLVLGRPYVSSDDPESNGTVEEVLAHAERKAPDEAHFRSVHRRAVRELTGASGIPLSQDDLARLEQIHRAFFESQLELRFRLHEANGRTYPTLRSLWTTRTPSGDALGFLASHSQFQVVQRLAQARRIIPVVGNFAGDHALASVADELRRRQLRVGAFYVSNVEQYLMEPADWKRWVANVHALPRDENAVFIRCYLDQGRAHPQQRAGHRTTTLLQPMGAFLTRAAQGHPGSFWALVTQWPAVSSPRNTPTGGGQESTR